MGVVVSTTRRGIVAEAEKPSPTCADIFLANMGALWRRDPLLAMRVDAVDDRDRLTLEPTRSGAWTARLKGISGKTTYLHSRYDPQADAEQLVESAELDEKYCFIAVGMGLGYHVEMLCDRLKGDAFVICVEPSMVVLATALTCVDLSDPIARGRVIFIVDTDKARLHQMLGPVSSLFMLGTQFLRHPPSAQVEGDALNELCRMITEFATFQRMSLVTLMGNSKITCRNIAMNLPHYISTPPIDRLADRFSGNPAVIISAGPSLRQNIDQLADLKGKAVLVAVQTTLRPLMERGIVPDFVTSLDFHEMSRKFFEGVGDLSKVHLVAEPKASWQVIDPYPGPVSILGNQWAKLLIGDELGTRGTLPAGATVSHLAFYLAAYMGCNPIIFVGQDLAFTGHVFYVPGVEIHRAWRSEINRFNTMEMKEWDRIARNGSIGRKVAASDGGELFADELLFTYLEQFEKDFASSTHHIINATEGGARIRGTEIMSLADATERFCAKPIDRSRFADLTSPRRSYDQIDAVRAELDQRIDDIDELHDLCEELLGILKSLKKLTHDPNLFNRRLIRVDELRSKVQRESRGYQIVNFWSQITELRRFSADRKMKILEGDEVERAERELQRDVEFISGVMEGAGEVREMLRDALVRLVRPEATS